MTLNLGDPAPAFTLPDADGKLVSLSDYKNGKVIVYFYPAALTPGCTLEAIDFSTSSEDFAKAGYQIVGISPDTPAKLEKFRSEKQLNLTLLADPDKQVIEEWGAWGTKTLYGKKMEGIIRSTFIVAVDAEGNGTIEKAYHNVRASGHVDRLSRDLGIAAA
jgi:peroxiredoxin Q/BCP